MIDVTTHVKTRRHLGERICKHLSTFTGTYARAFDTLASGTPLELGLERSERVKDGSGLLNSVPVAPVSQQ